MPNSQTTRTLLTASIALVFVSTTLAFPFAVLADQHLSMAATADGNMSKPSIESGSATPLSDALLPAFPVSLSLTDGSHPAQPIEVRAHTVAEALKDAGIIVEKDDKVAPALTEPVKAGMSLTVTRVRKETQTETAKIPYQTVFKMSHDVIPGHIQKGHLGIPGELTKTFQITYINEKLASRTLISKKVTRPPVAQETLGGIRLREARALPTRGGSYNRLRCYTMTATGYSPFEGSGSGRCATGIRAGYGVVAVDPRVIPLGSKLYIEGYGYAIAGDTGGAIKGRRIDLGHTTHHEASQVGRHPVKVWVLSPSR